jgi:Mg-chelatase subunit ChlD
MLTNVPRINSAEVCYSTAIDVVLVIDRSGSMNGEKIETAKSAAKKFLTVIQEEDSQGLTRVGIVSYSETSIINQRLTNNYSQLNSAIDNISTGGYTCIECGISSANKTLTEDGRESVPKIVIFLTDGLANYLINGSSQVSNNIAEEAALNELNSSLPGTKFYTVGLGSDVNDTFLQEIANRTGGQYYKGETDSLVGIYEQIASEILPSGLITGVIFEDVNNNGVYDPTIDNRLPFWQLQVTDSFGSSIITSNIDGVYTTSLLCAGDYTLELLQRPGYIQTFPSEGSLTVFVGDSPLTGYNFGVIKEIYPFWLQGKGGDMRINQNIKNIIPSGEYLSLPETNPEMAHGVVFGNSTLDWGGPLPEKANETGWFVADIKHDFPIINTRYSNIYAILERGGVMQYAKDIYDDACLGSPPNCQLRSNLENGVYKSDTTVIINNSSSYSFASNRNYIFLINEDLKIESNIIVPPGSTVMFIVRGDIFIDPDVKDLQGIYSTDNAFIVQGCMCDEGDIQLNIEGSIIANAAFIPNVISLINNRDLKLENRETPSILIKYRPDFVLNAPEILRYKSYSIKEVAPGS